MAKNWIASPLGINLLQNFLEKNAAKNNILENISEVFKNKKEFVIKNKLFYFAPDNKGDFLSGKNNKFYLEMEAFTSCQEAYIAVKNWVNQYGDFQQFTEKKCNSSDVKALLTNICMYKGAWKSSMVKIHNSFSYTEDIKYEGRVLVVSTCDEDVEFAIVVPNEMDVLCHLVKKLHKEGLSAALNTIQPAFTATCKQILPTFHFDSNIVLQDLEDPKLVPSQHGCVRVDQTGINIKVLTCLHVGNGTTKIDSVHPQISNDCFSFAIVCKDVPIFTGQVQP